MNVPPNDTATNVASGNTQARTAAAVSVNRTCTACQRRKIKCIVPVQEGNTDHKRCWRCSRLDLACVFPAPATKKTRKRNENRIRELERKLEAIQHAVAGAQATATVLSPPPSSEQWTQLPSSRSPATSASSLLPGSEPIIELTPPVPQATGCRRFNDRQGDPLASGLITYDFAKRLYENFRENLAPLYPIVLLPDASCAWETIQSDRPALFRAVLTASSSSIDPDLSESLFQDTAQFLANRVVLAAEKSLDLAQALLVMSTWYLPPKNFKDLNFTQYAHMAATMVAELRSSLDDHHAIPEGGPVSTPTEASLETCRTFVACYLLCSSMALSFRRPTVLQYGPWLEDCLNVLEAMPSPHVNDRRLASWTRLQRIAEESLTTVRLNNKWSSMDFNDPRTQFILKGCIERVTEWGKSVDENVMNDTLGMHYHMLLLNLHEPALYDEHNLGDFRPPYTIRAHPLTKPTSTETSFEAAHATAQCAVSARHILRTFINLLDSELLSVPVITYTRMTYAVVILTKLHVSTSPSSSATSLLPQNEDASPAKFLLQLIDRLGSAAGPQRFRVPAVFQSALYRLKEWCDEHLDQPLGQQRSGLIEPMMHLSIDNVNSSISKGEAVHPNTTLTSTSADSVVSLDMDTRHPVIPPNWEGSPSFNSGLWLDSCEGGSMLDLSDGFFDFIFVNQNVEDSHS